LNHRQVRVVTGDAMFAQRALSLLIVRAGGDYVWTVKDTLRESQLKTDIGQLFANNQRCVPGFGPAPTECVNGFWTPPERV
jgi:hypothetical protein